MVHVSKAYAPTAVHVVLILVRNNNRVVRFLKPPFRDLNPAFFSIMLILDDLAIDIKHVDLVSTKIKMGVRGLLIVIEVKSHFHESIVDFAWVEVDVEGVLDGLGFDE